MCAVFCCSVLTCESHNSLYSNKGEEDLQDEAEDRFVDLSVDVSYGLPQLGYVYHGLHSRGPREGTLRKFSNNCLMLLLYFIYFLALFDENEEIFHLIPKSNQFHFN